MGNSNEIIQNKPIGLSNLVIDKINVTCSTQCPQSQKIFWGGSFEIKKKNLQVGILILSIKKNKTCKN